MKNQIKAMAGYTINLCSYSLVSSMTVLIKPMNITMLPLKVKRQ